MCYFHFVETNSAYARTLIYHLFEHVYGLIQKLHQQNFFDPPPSIPMNCHKNALKITQNHYLIAPLSNHGMTSFIDDP